MLKKPQIDAKYFPALDGLRAICIALVVFTHVHRTGFLGHIEGAVGVDIFFAISGFLITTLLLREEEKNSKIDLVAFYIRRVFRILPLYFFVLVIYGVTSYGNPIRWTAYKHMLPYGLTFMNDVPAMNVDKVGGNAALGDSVFGASWSLAIEEKFYLIWPFLLVCISSKRFRLLTLLLLFLGVALLPYRMFHSYTGLLLGCGLAFALKERPALRVAFARLRPEIVLLLMALSLWLVDINKWGVFAFLPPTCILIGTLLCGNNWLVTLFSSHAFVWIGRRSYSMYLLQAIALNIVKRFIVPSTQPKQLLVTAVAFTLSLLLADVTYRFIEEPTRIYGKKLLASRHHVASSISPGLTAD